MLTNPGAIKTKQNKKNVWPTLLFYDQFDHSQNIQLVTPTVIRSETQRTFKITEQQTNRTSAFTRPSHRAGFQLPGRPRALLLCGPIASLCPPGLGW